MLPQSPVFGSKHQHVPVYLHLIIECLSWGKYSTGEKKFRPVYHHRPWGNIVAKNLDYLIHSTLQTMPYYSENYAEHKYREYLVM